MNLSFRDSIRTMVPPWLADRFPLPLTNGFRFLYCNAAVLDAFMQVAVEGLRAKYPGIGTPTALPYLGRDRLILRGPDESDAHYAARLVGWLQAWRLAGSAVAVLNQLYDYFSPATPPLLRLVTNWGTWYTLAPDGTLTIQRYTMGEAAPWNWDNRPDLWARCWVIIYSPNGVPWGPDRAWGEGGKWGDGRRWGTTATRDQVVSIQQIVAQWKGAHALYPNVIISFDPAAFAPDGSGAQPDGTWGTYYKIVGGVAVPSRYANARYWDGAS